MNSSLFPRLYSVLLTILLLTGCSQSPEAKYEKYMQQGKEMLASRDYQRALIAFRNASKTKEAAAEPHYQAGLVFLKLGETANAGLSFQMAARLNPKHADASAKLAELMASSKDMETVRQGGNVARQVLELSPDNPDAVNTLALVDLRLGKVSEASAHLEEAVKRHPAHVGLALNLARSRSANADPTGAENALRAGIAKDPQALVLVLALGDLYLQMGDLSKAEQQYRQALTIAPGDGPASLALTSVLIKANRPAEAEQVIAKLAHGQDTRYRTALAAFLFEQGKHDSAIAELEQLWAKNPADREIRTGLVSAYLNWGKTAKAESILAEALKHNENDVDALIQRAKMFLLKSAVDQAAADLNKALNSRPDSSEARFLLSRVYRTRGDGKQARTQLQEALRLDPKFLAARLELAQILQDANDSKTALSVLDEAPAEQKRMASLVLRRNWSLIAEGRTKEIKPAVEAILKVGPVSEALLQLATLHLEAREYQQAKSSLETALSKTPDDARILHLLARAYAGEGQAAAGIKRIQDHVATRPEAYGLKAFLGHMLLANGRKQEARVPLEAAVAGNPQLTVAQLDLAELDQLEGKPRLAIPRLQALLPSDRDGSIRVRLATLHESQGEYARAAELYREALGLDSNNLIALNNLAYHLADREGKANEALRFAQQAKELAPEDLSIDDTLGWVYYHKGLYSLAIRHLERATKQSTAARQYHLAMAYLRNGDFSKGQNALSVALRLNPNLPEADNARQVLKEMTADAANRTKSE